MLSTAIGAFHWSPREFWAATPHEYFAAVEYHERVAAKIAENNDGG